MYKAFGKEHLSRKFQGKSERTFKDSPDKLKTLWAGGKFNKMTGKYNGSNDRIKKSEERPAKMSQAEGITSKGNFEQRRSGWNNEESKASCFECGVLITLKLYVPFGSPQEERCQVSR